MVYKFVSDGERTGFVRDEAYAGENYQSCTFAEGEHFFVSLTQAIADKVAAASGKTNHEDLDFIVWHGPTPADAVATAIQTVATEQPAAVTYDLSGRRVTGTAKQGLYIRDGKKLVVK